MVIYRLSRLFYCNNPKSHFLAMSAGLPVRLNGLIKCTTTWKSTMKSSSRIKVISVTYQWILPNSRNASNYRVNIYVRTIRDPYTYVWGSDNTHDCNKRIVNLKSLQQPGRWLYVAPHQISITCNRERKQWAISRGSGILALVKMCALATTELRLETV